MKNLFGRWKVCEVTRFTCILSQLPPCKIRKTIGMLSKLRHFVPCSVLVNIYNALITPYLTFGPVSWGKAWKTYLDKILILQKCALRLIYSANRQDHIIPLFVKAKVLSLNILYYDERNATIIIWNLFSRTSNSHHYFTRSPASQDFHVKKILT